MKHNRNHDRARLKVGAWYSVKYGEFLTIFCVIAIRGNKILAENPDWNLCDSEWFDIEEFFMSKKESRQQYLAKDRFIYPLNAKFLGYGKPRWFMWRVRKLTQCYGTLYTKPHSVTIARYHDKVKGQV